MKDRDARIEIGSRVMLKDGDEHFPAIVKNISKTGMSLLTDHVPATYKEVEVVVKLNQKVVPVKGSVRWVYEAVEVAVEPGCEPLNEVGVGLKDPPPEYLNHFR